MAEMIVLAGSVRIAPGHKAQALPHIKAIVAASRAEAGCLSYHVAFDVLDDHLVRIFEVFESAEALAAHQASTHMVQWRESWAQAGIGDRAMGHYDVAAWREI